MPYDSVWLIWLPDGTAVVDEDVPDPAQETSGPALVQKGDVLLAIDGIPTRYTDLRFRFGPRAPTHSYDIRRGQDDFTVIIASGSPTALELFNLLLPAIVALEAWLVGFVIVLLARDQDHDAWHVGSVMLGFAVALAAARAGGVGIPGARLAYGVLVPVMGVGYFEMALLPDRLRRRSPIVFRILYGLAAVLAVGMLVEILILNPNANWTALIGIRFEAFVLGLLALSILAAPITIAVRSWRQPSGYSRRQANILLLGTGVALLPFVLLSALPYAIATTTLLPVEVTLPLLGAIPATYAYVIYRHRFLRLDPYAGRSILLVITALIIAVVFYSSQRVSQASPQLASIAPFVGMVSVLVAFAVVSQTTPRLKPAIDFLLYGPDRHFDQALQVITRELVANPRAAR